MLCVVSDEETAPLRRQVGIRKAKASESLMKCRRPICDIETGAYALSWDESGGCAFTGATLAALRPPGGDDAFGRGCAGGGQDCAHGEWTDLELDPNHSMALMNHSQAR